MKTDIYTKIILTVIALCLLFNVGKDLKIVSSIKADDKAAEISSSQSINTLRTNADGSINVKMVAADVIEVKPASGAEFKVVPSGSSTRFRVEPYSSSTEFSVVPSGSSTRFKVEPYSSSTEFSVKPTYNARFEVKQAYNSEISVKPAYGAVFDVREQSSSYITPEEVGQINSIYPNPAQEQIIIEYSIQDAEYLTICSINGNMLYYSKLDPAQNRININVSDYAAGAYIYSHGRISGKFIKK